MRRLGIIPSKREIFISYRRADSGSVTGRIFDELVDEFGAKSVFRDIDSIPLGIDFREHIRKELSSCRVFLVVIGPGWLGNTPASDSYRIHETNDLIRVEIEIALSRTPPIPCIPILVDGAELPPEHQFPEEIRSLVNRNALKVRHDPDFHHDVERLVDHTRAILGKRPRPWFLSPLAGLAALVIIGLGSLVVRLVATKRDEQSPVAAVEARKAEPKQDSAPVIHSLQTGKSWTNALGMKFEPVEGTQVLFSVWETRVRDYRGYAEAMHYQVVKPAFEQSDNEPAVNVTWTEAQDFCAWLTRSDQDRGAMTEYQRYRLPTDAEWSTAVDLGPEQGASPEERGKNAELTGELIFPWGKEWPPKRNAGNYGGEESVTKSAPKCIAGYRDDYPYTSPAGSFPANRFKLCDLSGNVWEWCQDWMDSSEKTRVLRGGSYNNVSPRRLTSAFRNDDQPDVRYPQVGFRCVIEFLPH